MTFGIHDTRPRRRRGLQWTFLKVLLVLLFMLGLGLFAYEGGSMLAQRSVVVLKKQVSELDGKLAALGQENAELEAAVAASEARAAEWQGRYEQEVPTGRGKELFDLVRERLGAGIESDRLAFLIGAAENRKSCDAETATKRFFVQTPLYQGANDSVSFAQERITITAQGETAVNQAGDREGWFDPAKQLTLRFTELGGKTSDKTGTLPLHQSIVIGDSEYRFSAVAGDRGFVKVTGTKCPFP